MQVTWSQPVAELVMLANDCASRLARPRRRWATSSRTRVADGRSTGCCFVTPADPTHLAVVVTAQRAQRSRRDPVVHQDQLRPADDAFVGEVFHHQLAGAVLVGGVGHNERTHRDAGHVHRVDSLGAFVRP